LNKITRKEKEGKNNERWDKFSELNKNFKFDTSKQRSTLILIDDKNLDNENKIRLIKKYKQEDEDLDPFVGDVLPKLWKQITEGWKKDAILEEAESGDINGIIDANKVPLLENNTVQDDDRNQSIVSGRSDANKSMTTTDDPVE